MPGLYPPRRRKAQKKTPADLDRGPLSGDCNSHAAPCPLSVRRLFPDFHRSRLRSDPALTRVARCRRSLASSSVVFAVSMFTVASGSPPKTRTKSSKVSVLSGDVPEKFATAEGPGSEIE